MTNPEGLLDIKTNHATMQAQINTEAVLLRKLNFLLQEEANIADSCLLWVVEYCAKNNIPIGEEKRLKNLLIDSKRIMKEIKETSTTLEKVCYKPPSDEILQIDESDEDYTKPCHRKSLYTIKRH